MSLQLLGVAVVGLGVGEQHARAYLRTAGCTLLWLYDIDANRMHRIANALGEGETTDSYECIIADPFVDVVSIASYDDAHFTQVVSALEAGKHVFVEKPLCRSLEELRIVKQAWQVSGCQRMISNLVLRAAPIYQWLLDAIGSGELGEIYAFDGDYLYGRIHKINEGWRKDVDNYSVMQGGGVHLVDLMLWLTNQKPVSVTTVGNSISTAGSDFRYDDFMAATFQFPSGLIGRITANFGCVHGHQHVVRVFGTKGTFIHDDQGPRLHATRDSSSPARVLDLSTLPGSKGDLIPGFVAGIMNGTDERSHTQHEFDVISACVTADKSLATKSTIEIEYA